MNILLINDREIGGGAERVMLDLVEALCQLGEQPTVICTHGRIRNMRRVFSFVGVNLISLSPFIRCCMNNKFVRLCNKLWAYCKLFRPKRIKWDVVLAFKEGSTMALAAEFNATRKLGWIHVDYRFLYWTQTVFSSPEAELSLMKKFNNIICVSQAVVDGLRTVVGDPGNLCVRYNPLNVEQIRKKGKHELGMLPHRLPLFVAVGRLVEEKNYKMLISCAIKLLHEFDFDLWIIGDGPQQRQLQKLIVAANAQHNIKLLGKKENPYPYIRQADWFISSCFCESYGIAIQESLILGVPVIATRGPALDEVCDSRFTILCDNTPDDLIATWHSVLTQPAIGNQYRCNIRQFYPNHQSLYTDRIASILQLASVLSS